MTYWAHKWLLILAVMLGGVIGVCGANATTGSAGKSPVLHAMPRSSNAEKKLPSANDNEAEEKIAAQQATAAVQDLVPKDDPVSKMVVWKRLLCLMNPKANWTHLCR